MNKFRSRSFQKSLMFALNGVRLAFKSQRNFRKHIVIALLTFAIAYFLKVSLVEFCIIIFANTLYTNYITQIGSSSYYQSF